MRVMALMVSSSLLLLVLAGCTGPASTTTTTGPHVDPWMPHYASLDKVADWSPQVLVATANSAEPGLHAASDGTLYLDVWNRLYRSSDSGSTWDQLAPGLDTNGDASVSVDPDGTVHMVASGLAGKPLQIPYVRSTDDGATWSEPVELLPTKDPVDRPWIVAHADGRVALVWNDWQGTKSTPVRLSTDGGLTWGPAETPAPEHYLRIGEPIVRGADLLIPLIATDHLAFLRHDGSAWSYLRGPEAETGIQVIGAQAAVDGGGWVHLVVGVWNDGMRSQVAYRSEDLAAWDGPHAILPERESVRAWPVGGAGAGELFVAAYVRSDDIPATPSVPGLPVNPGGALKEWHVGVATLRYTEAGLETDGLYTSEEPVRKGEICTGGAGCADADWAFRDYFMAVALPDGAVGIAHDRDGGNAGRVEVVFTKSR